MSLFTAPQNFCHAQYILKISKIVFAVDRGGHLALFVNKHDTKMAPLTGKI